MFFGGGNRGEILGRIAAAVRDKEDIIHVHGERGSGKTMLSLVLSDRLKHRYHSIRYDHPEICASRLLRYLLIELCPRQAHLISQNQAKNGADRASVNAAIACIDQQLTRAEQAGRSNKPYLLFIDSNSQLDAEALKVIERLNRIKVDGRSVIHAIIFHLCTTNRPVMAGEVAFQTDNHFWLRRLTLTEIGEYLNHHMMLFDFNRKDLFTREMAYFIADRSEGVFRSINTLARNAFSIANLEDSDKLSMSHLLMAGLPLPEEMATESRFFGRHRAALLAMISLSVVASVSVAYTILS